MQIFHGDEFAEEWERASDIYCWADEIEASAYLQATNLAKLPFLFKHVAIMPDVHCGFGMPIGGVIACVNTVIPNAVGRDKGCGMGFALSNRSVYDYPQEDLTDLFKKTCHSIKRSVPVGFNVHRTDKNWDGFDDYLNKVMDDKPGWMTNKCWGRALKSLGTLGGGNHFIELQKTADQDAYIGIMLHSGSRNLGSTMLEFYHNAALAMCEKWHSKLPHKELAYLPVDSGLGQDYIRDMNFALDFARENRARMMTVAKQHMKYYFGAETKFVEEVNIHHNYASLEHHMGKNVWVHRKGATSAKKGQLGIIPGSMGTPSYIVMGKGNPLSFSSCSHGAGRKMSRTDACINLKEEDCWSSMADVVFDGFGKVTRGRAKNRPDLGEAPGAYKDIDIVIESQLDLINLHRKMLPLAVVKG